LHSVNRPLCLLALTLSGLVSTLFAIIVDTAYYSGPAATKSFSALYHHIRYKPVITPLNNLLYNSQTSNLAQHGLHPHYQHLVANLPQLLGPALVLLVAAAYPFNLRMLKGILANNRLASAATGLLFLSLIPHQELRFLLPLVPLILTSIRVPTSKIPSRLFWVSWISFNASLAILMGVYHQGGVIPAQLAMPDLILESIENSHSKAHNIEVFWWKTYPPPTFALGPELFHPATKLSLNISTVPLMGYPQSELVFMLMQHMPTCDPTLIERLFIHKEKTDIFVVAPLAAWRLAPFSHRESQTFEYPPVANFSFAIDMNQPPAQLQLNNLAVFRQHINLDDLDFGDDGVWPTLERVIGRRGLGVWKVDRICGPVQYVDAHTGENMDLPLEGGSQSEAVGNLAIESKLKSTPGQQAEDTRQEQEKLTRSSVAEDEIRTISTTTIPADFSDQQPSIAA
jgi:GPI mannosyltransferase 4